MWLRYNLLFPMVALLLTTGCGQETPNTTAQSKPELLIYCGITMAHPITAIARIIEKEQNVTIKISQGGSEDLYQALKESRKGDLYLPGSASYRKQHLDEGLLGDFVHLGYNQAALLVPKGNPKGLKADLNNLTRKDLAVVACNPETGSIGRETKRILQKFGNYQAVMDNAVFLTTDSRNMNKALEDGDADIILNWRATAFFPENSGKFDALDLDPAVAEPKKLLLNLLTFSKHPAVARRFMEYAASPEGQAIFRQYGFIDNTKKFE
ncbi:MAG: substrate-binding domain-containing protein [Gammaproteobacteria bacterium]|nr:substrate-binding domain-containing protein [Gammaproteobacteria bacterium]MBU1654378.1 substrate-binding domain-containing protein [Gammaproteobacteria bacterium]MBU1960279.1 substrate-binding domain-containing protein [Gammaproteobacteria bacterium]